ncbi:hypothetical protein JCM10450v2_001415 [Rhodotorula kratochvilovae]
MSGMSASTDPAEDRTAKRRRTSGGARAPPRRPVKGSLQGVLTLPVELVLRVCADLDFATLFHLSRLNKQFYRVLRAPSAKSVWETVREDDGLHEPLASGMDVYALANLLFGCCQGCGKLTTIVDWYLRKRFCRPCGKNVIVDGDKIPDELQSTLRHAPYSYFEHNRIRKWKNFYLPDIVRLSGTVKRVEEQARRAVQARASRILAQDGPASLDTDILWAEEDISDVEWDDASLVARRSIGSLREFEDATADMQEARQHDAIRLIDWVEGREEAKEKERKMLCAKRRNAIEERLLAMGYRPHLFGHPRWIYSTAANSVKELTDRTFPTALAEFRSILGPYQEELDAQRCSAETMWVKMLIREQHRALSSDPDAAIAVGLYPLNDVDEFLAMDSVKALWTFDDVEETYTRVEPVLAEHAAAIAADLTAAKRKTYAVLLVDLVRALSVVEGEIRTAATQEASAAQATDSRTGAAGEARAATSGTHEALWLPRDLPADIADIPTVFDDHSDELFALAVSAFECTRCCEVDRFPRLFAHNCRGTNEKEHRVASFCAHTYVCKPDHIRAAVEVLRAAGQSLRVPPAEMDALGRAFSCECTAKMLNAHGQDWVTMIHHRAQGVHGLLSSSVHARAIAEELGLEVDWDAAVLFETPALIKERIFRRQQEMFTCSRRGRDV